MTSPNARRRRGGFNWADNRLILEFGDQLGPNGLAVYYALALHANQRAATKTGARQSWPSLTTIGREIGVCKRTVTAAVRRLELLGLVKVERGRKSPQGDSTSNLYTLVEMSEAVWAVQPDLFDFASAGARDDLPAAAGIGENSCSQPPSPEPTCAGGVGHPMTHGGSSSDPGVGHLMTQGGSQDVPLTRRMEQDEMEQDEGGGANRLESLPPLPRYKAPPPPPPQPSPSSKPGQLRAFDPETEPLEDPDPLGPLSLARQWHFQCAIPPGSKLWDPIDTLVPQIRELLKKVSPGKVLTAIADPQRDKFECFSKFREALLRPPAPRLPSREEIEAQIAEKRAQEAIEARRVAPPGTFRRLLEEAGLRDPRKP